MGAAQKLFEKMYEQAQAAGAQGAGPDMSGFTGAGANTSSQDTSSDAGFDSDVVDGDYKEV